MSPSLRLSGHPRRPQLMGGRPRPFWVVRLFQSCKETLWGDESMNHTADTAALTELVWATPLANCWDDPKPAFLRREPVRSSKANLGG